MLCWVIFTVFSVPRSICCRFGNALVPLLYCRGEPVAAIHAGCLIVERLCVFHSLPVVGCRRLVPHNSGSCCTGWKSGHHVGRFMYVDVAPRCGRWIYLVTLLHMMSVVGNICWIGVDMNFEF